MKNFRCELRDDEVGTLDFHGVIGDGIFGGTSSREVAEELKALGNVRELHIDINSPGGSGRDGVSIMNMLAAHPARVIVEVSGWAASAASVIAMAGDEIRMATAAMMMIHNPMGDTYGDAEEHRRNAEHLDKIQDSIIALYAAKTGTDKDQIREMMRVETVLNAEECVEMGFATETVDRIAVAACVDRRCASQALFDRMKAANPPATDEDLQESPEGTPLINEVDMKLRLTRAGRAVR